MRLRQRGLLCCAIPKEKQEQHGEEEAESGVDGTLGSQRNVDHVKNEAVQGKGTWCCLVAQAKERKLSHKELSFTLLFRDSKQKRNQGKGEAETSNNAAVIQRLEADIGGISKNERAAAFMRKALIRILVIGRSGAGKTTLIRLLVGDEGPQSISEGIAGVQDINKEFLYFFEEEGVSFIIHDSNGMDVKGKERVDEILAFLDKHQKCTDFTEHIHVVWYVISAIDPRFVEDGNVMKVVRGYKIPLLLIMTHEDYDKVKVTESSLNRLLQEAYENIEEREALKKLMVKVHNEGVRKGANGELIIDDGKRDNVGLRLVAARTKSLVDRMLIHS